MSDATGPRLAELLLAEFVGRTLGPLETLRVAGLDDPAGFACAVDEAYTLEAAGDRLATVAVRSHAVEVTREPDGPTLRVEDGARLKSAVDEVATWADQTGQQAAT
ncbi:MAG: hypothetical protein ACOC0X_03490 [Halobacteriota archaeon]